MMGKANKLKVGQNTTKVLDIKGASVVRETMPRSRQSDSDARECRATGTSGGAAKPKGSTKNVNRSIATRFQPGKSGNPTAKNVPPGPGVPSRREDGRYWHRRNMEVPEDKLSPVPFCAADALSRHAIKEAKATEGKDAAQTYESLMRVAYGDKLALTAETTELTPEQVRERYEARQRELRELEGGGK